MSSMRKILAAASVAGLIESAQAIGFVERQDEQNNESFLSMESAPAETLFQDINGIYICIGDTIQKSTEDSYFKVTGEAFCGEKGTFVLSGHFVNNEGERGDDTTLSGEDAKDYRLVQGIIDIGSIVFLKASVFTDPSTMDSYTKFKGIQGEVTHIGQDVRVLFDGPGTKSEEVSLNRDLLVARINKSAYKDNTATSSSMGNKVPIKIGNRVMLKQKGLDRLKNGLYFHLRGNLVTVVDIEGQTARIESNEVTDFFNLDDLVRDCYTNDNSKSIATGDIIVLVDDFMKEFIGKCKLRVSKIENRIIEVRIGRDSDYYKSYIIEDFQDKFLFDSDSIGQEFNGEPSWSEQKDKKKSGKLQPTTAPKMPLNNNNKTWNRIQFRKTPVAPGRVAQVDNGQRVTIKNVLLGLWNWSKN